MFIPVLFLISLLSYHCVADVLPFDDWPHQRVKLENVSIHLRYAGSGPPILLVHGNPQHSLTWSTVGPILAQNYTVIACDNRGAGDSSIPANDDYTASTQADDLYGVLQFLGINQTYVFSHDKGVGYATALAAKFPSLVRRLGIAEYPLPGFGYEEFWTPKSDWSLYSNWQLAFFSVPDAATYFIAGKEREMLSWYFFHASYSGSEGVTQDHLSRYTDSISKPGFLRSMFGPFQAASVEKDAAFFNETIGKSKLSMPVLAMGGEASFAPKSLLQQFFAPVAEDLQVDVEPKAGHWIADENPVWLANRILQFVEQDNGTIPSVDLSYLADLVTLV